MANKIQFEHLLKYKKEQRKLNKKHIVEYYGQNWDNVKHLKNYVDSLVDRYKHE